MSEQNKETSSAESQDSVTKTQNEKTPLDIAYEEANKWKTDYLYLRAEFDNFRKHSIKERSELSKYGAERFLQDFLEVIDNMDRALSSTPSVENISSYVMGVQMIAKEIKSVLARHGVVSEECHSLPFDPSKHEALGTEPTNDMPPGHIARVVKVPYRLHDKLLRPAQVLVATDLK